MVSPDHNDWLAAPRKGQDHATSGISSGIFYDNVDFSMSTTLVSAPLRGATAPGLELSVRGNPARGLAAQELAFTIARDDRVSVRVYDVGGGLVATLLDREIAAGEHRLRWQGRDANGRAVTSGVYFAEVVAGTERAVTKLTRVR